MKSIFDGVGMYLCTIFSLYQSPDLFEDPSFWTILVNKVKFLC